MKKKIHSLSLVHLTQVLRYVKWLFGFHFLNSKKIPFNVQFFERNVTKIWHLNTKNIKDSDISEEMKGSRYGSKQILSKCENAFAKEPSD